MATRNSSEVERRRLRVRRRRTQTRPPRQASQPPKGSSRHTKSADADDASSGEPPDIQADLYEVLDHFGNALAIVQTVSNALQAAQNNLKCPAVGSEIATLRHGVTALIAVHEEFDRAFSGVDT